jgi:predicted ATPase/DNA-binding SARP family transcriptional activator
LDVLGPLRATVSGSPLEVAGRRVLGLLGLLAVHAGTVLRTDEILELLWDGSPPPSAAAALQVNVSRLRKALSAVDAGSVVVTRASGYLLDLEPEAVDALRFAGALDRVTRTSPAPDEAEAGMDQALGWWRGRALADLLAMRWANLESQRLESLRLDAVTIRADARLALGRHTEVVSELQPLVDEHPLRERLWAQLMIALYRSGRQVEALRTFGRLRKILAEELGIEPTTELAQLELDVLNHAAWLAAVDPPRPFEPGPARSAGAGGPRRQHNLPLAVSTFVGRTDDLDLVGRALERVRLVTLTGAGGVGKSRLAIEVARAGLGAWADGVWLVELAGVPDGDGVIPAAAAVLGLLDPSDDAHDGLIDALVDRNLLMVLDNCEHCLDACAQLVADIGRSCPNVHVLATSREPLRVEGERVVRVPPLAVPERDGWELADLAGYGAIQLFVERAQSQQGVFRLVEANAATVVAICRRLDGIPLALELASAQLRGLPITEIEHRLDRRFELAAVNRRDGLAHHQTLGATVEWSYQLLDERERAVLRRLSVFPAGWELDAGAAVGAGPELVGDGVVAALMSLVDKSLVQADPTPGGRLRYRLLQTVQQFARDRLAEGGPDDEEVARLAHARAYLALVEEGAPHLIGLDQVEWLERLDHELDNLRAAGATLLERPDCLDDALRFGVALWDFWYLRLEGREGIESLERALGRVPPERHDLLVCEALDALGQLLKLVNEWDRSWDRLQQSLAMARELGNDRLVASALSSLSTAIQQRGASDDETLAMADDAVAAARRSGHANTIATAVCRRAIIRGRLLYLAGDREEGTQTYQATYAATEADYREALAYYAEASNRRMVARTLCSWAARLMAIHRLDEARPHLEAALHLANQHKDDRLLPSVLECLGDLARQQGDLALAQGHLSEALRIFFRQNDRRNIDVALMDISLWCRGAGDAATAALLRGAIAAQRARVGVSSFEGNLEEYDADEQVLRMLLGNQGYERAYQDGRMQPLAAVVERVSQLPPPS